MISQAPLHIGTCAVSDGSPIPIAHRAAICGALLPRQFDTKVVFASSRESMPLVRCMQAERRHLNHLQTT